MYLLKAHIMIKRPEEEFNKGEKNTVIVVGPLGLEPRTNRL